MALTLPANQKLKSQKHTESRANSETQASASEPPYVQNLKIEAEPNPTHQISKIHQDEPLWRMNSTLIRCKQRRARGTLRDTG